MCTLLETKVETRRFIFPGQSNAIETAHGGDLVKWMEQIGAMSAMRFAGTEAVTVGMDDVRLEGAIPQGSIAFLDAYVYDAGTSSVRTWVRGYDEDRYTGDRERVTEAAVTLVAVDDDGEKTQVPGLSVETEEGQRLQTEALDH